MLLLNHNPAKKMKKETRGGRRDNAGRKPQNQILGARVKTAITLRADHFETLGGKNRSAYIAAGLDVVQYALGRSPGIDACLIAYYAIRQAIERLERIRDYNPDTGFADEGFYWSQEEEAMHSLLCEWWEQIRNQPLYKAAKLPTL